MWQRQPLVTVDATENFQREDELARFCRRERRTRRGIVGWIALTSTRFPHATPQTSALRSMRSTINSARVRAMTSQPAQTAGFFADLFVDCDVGARTIHDAAFPKFVGCQRTEIATPCLTSNP
jgi:hypothetical protein